MSPTADTASRRARPGAYSRVLGALDLPWGGQAIMERPRATRQARYEQEAPELVRMIERARWSGVLTSWETYCAGLEDYLAEHPDEDTRTQEQELGTIRSYMEPVRRRLERLGGELDGAERIDVAVDEIEATCRYLAEHTRALEGVDDVSWGELGAEERAAFYDALGVQQVYLLAMSYSTLIVTAQIGHADTPGA